MARDIRLDAFINAVTGSGTNRDKRTYGVPAVVNLTREDQESLYRGYDLGATFVEKLPDELLREGFRVTIKDDPELEEKVNTYLAQLEFLPRLTEALYWSRKSGGAGILVGADDGNIGDLSVPLDFDNIKSIDFFTTFDRWELYPLYYYGDPIGPKYARVSVFFLQQLFGLPQEVVDPSGMNGQGQAGAKGAFVPESNSMMTQMLNYPEITFKLTSKGYEGRGTDPEYHKRSSLITTAAPLRTVHESRFLLFDGSPVTRVQRVRNNGWGDSIFTRVFEVLRDYQMSWDGVATLMQDFAQGKFKLQGLNEMMLGGDDKSIQARIALLDMQRSNARSIYLDAGKDGEPAEDFTRDVASLTGIPEVLSAFAMRLAAAGRMPISLLMGQPPAGLNANDKSGIQWYYDQIKSKQYAELQPQLKYLLKIIFATKDGPTGGVEPENWDVIFNPLWQLGSLEEAQRRLFIQQADVGYVTAGVLNAEEVAESRFAEDTYNGDSIALNNDAREEHGLTSEVTIEHDADGKAMAAKGIQTDQNGKELGIEGQKIGLDQQKQDLKNSKNPQNGPSKGGAKAKTNKQKSAENTRPKSPKTSRNAV